MHKKLIEFAGFTVAALVWIGAIYLGQLMLGKWKKPSPVSNPSDLNKSELDRLGGIFRWRRNVAITLALWPFLAVACYLAWEERFIEWMIGNFPVPILAVFGGWCLALVYTAIFVRCPLCRTVPLSWMSEVESSYSGRPRSKGLSLFAEQCSHCGLKFNR